MRYQFEPRSEYDRATILNRAAYLARANGCKHVRAAYPILYPMDGTKVVGKGYRATNQPKTITFSADSNERVKYIAEAIGSDLAFIWNIDEKHYV